MPDRIHPLLAGTFVVIVTSSACPELIGDRCSPELPPCPSGQQCSETGTVEGKCIQIADAGSTSGGVAGGATGGGTNGGMSGGSAGGSAGGASGGVSGGTAGGTSGGSAGGSAGGAGGGTAGGASGGTGGGSAGGSSGGAAGGSTAGGTSGGVAGGSGGGNSAGGTAGGAAGGSLLGTPSLTLTPQAMKIFHFSWADVTGETEYRLLESPDGVAPLSVVATLGANSTSHDLVVPLFRRLGARYLLRACNGSTCSDSQPVTVAGSLAGAVGSFAASNDGAGDRFGWAVAVSADGTTLAIGAAGEDSSAIGIGGNQSDESAAASGAVYVFSRTGTVWSQQAYVKASNTEAADTFGFSVSLSSDGSTLAVGAPQEDSIATGIGGNQSDNSASNSGAVYVFSRSGTAWAQQAYVKASNTAVDDAFGENLSLSGDGSTLVVGAVFEDSNATGIGGNQADNSAVTSGAAYVFSRNGAVWSQQAYVKASNSEAYDRFGTALALSANGNTLVVGAPRESSAATGVGGNQADNSAGAGGAVYVFSRSGTTWSQQAYVKASNTGATDGFGSAVAVSADGATLAVGAPGESSNATGIGGNEADNSALRSGAVYVFTRAVTAWSQQAYVKASNTAAQDFFGTAVALSGDGSTLAVTAPFEASNAIGIGGNQADNSQPGRGAVYTLTRSGTSWSQQAYVKPPGSSWFGFSPVALAGDGTALIVGAWAEASESGRVFAY